MEDDDVDMDLLVDDQPDPDEDFADGHNKEDTEPQSQAEKNENELNSNGIAQEGYDVIRGTENFIRRTIGLSAEDLDELVQANADKADAIAAVQENAATAAANDEDEDDDVVGGPADVTVIGDDGEATSVTQNDAVNEEIEQIIDSVDTPAEAQAVECLRRIFSREDESDGADVNITVDNGEQNTSAEFSGDAVTISPADSDDAGDDFGEDTGNEGSDDVNEDEGSDDAGEDEESDEGSDEGAGEEEPSDEDEGKGEGSEESWLSVLL